MKIMIHVTKEIYRRAMFCGVFGEFIDSTCAVALSVREIAPDASVRSDRIEWIYGLGLQSILPPVAKKMICTFDDLLATPQERLYLPEFSFEVDFPDELVQRIGLGQVYKILSESKTLTHVTQ